MTERTVEVIAQEPLLQTLAVEDVETAQLADFLGAIHLVQADGTGESQSIPLSMLFRKVGKSLTRRNGCPQPPKVLMYLSLP